MGWAGFVGSESDIELVAVSFKFDFSERPNPPNRELDPDRKLPKGIRGLLIFPLSRSNSSLFSPSVGNT